MDFQTKANFHFVERLKEDTWNLELAKQELTMNVTELQQNLNRMSTEQARLMKHVNDLSTEMERMRDKEEKLNQTIEDMKTRHEHDMSLIRRHAAGLQREKVDQAKQIETLMSELAIAKAQTRINKRSMSDLQVVTKTDRIDSASPDTSDKEHASPKASPPSSPRQTSGGNQMLEVETLKTSLAHAHRMVSNLRSTLHREKTEKFELKKLLAESQETIEQMQNDPRMWVDAGGRGAAEGTPRRSQHKKKRRTAARKARAVGSRRQEEGENDEEWIEEEEISDSQVSTDAEEEEQNVNAAGFTTLSSELSKSQQRLQTLDDQLMLAEGNQNHVLSLGDQLAQVAEREHLSSSSMTSLGAELAQADVKQATAAVSSGAGATVEYIDQSAQASISPAQRTDAATQTDGTISTVVESSIQTSDTSPSLQTVRIPSMSAMPVKRNTLHEATLETVSLSPTKRNTLQDATLEFVGVTPMKRNTLHEATLESVDVSPAKRNTLHDATLESVSVTPAERGSFQDFALDSVNLEPLKRNTLRDATLESVNYAPKEHVQLQDATLVSASNAGASEAAVLSTEHMSPVPSNAVSMSYEDIKRYSLRANDNWAEATLKAVQHSGSAQATSAVIDHVHQSAQKDTAPASAGEQGVASQKEASCEITPVPSSTEDFKQNNARSDRSVDISNSITLREDPVQSSSITFHSNQPREQQGQLDTFSTGTVASKSSMLSSDNHPHIPQSAGFGGISHGTNTETAGAHASMAGAAIIAQATSGTNSQNAADGSMRASASESNIHPPTFATENVQSMSLIPSIVHSSPPADTQSAGSRSDLLTRAEAEAMVEAAVAEYRKRLEELKQIGSVTVYPPSSPEIPPPRPTSPAPSSLLNKALSTRSRALSVSSASESRFGTALVSSQSTTYSSRRFDERRGSDSISSGASTIERRPSLTSSQIDAAARTANSLTDPNAIALITQTMIGDWMWKYTRKAVGNGLSERRHRRFFWIHPYTRTLYWGPHAPGTDGKESKAKNGVYKYIEIYPNLSYSPNRTF